ncbi:unannotated protein [freshwater metagenome]|uniref:Unannotated protein n=1 Tax=freshwater metagenome TaxID=449393 RepID=A0A6J7SQD1_9ZZZZ
MAGVVEFVGPSCVMEEVRSHEWHVNITAFADGLAVIHRFKYRKFTATFLNDAGNAIEVFSTIGAAHL